MFKISTPVSGSGVGQAKVCYSPCEFVPNPGAFEAETGYLQYFYELLTTFSPQRYSGSVRNIIFKCLNSNVKSIEDFHKQILKLYPASRYPRENAALNEAYSKIEK